MTRARGYVEIWRPRTATRTVIDLALAAIATERIVTPRLMLYLAIEHGLTSSRGRPLDKSKSSYGTVIDAMGMTRRAGLIPWEAVADTTERIDPLTYLEPDEFKGEMVEGAKRYRLDWQDRYIVAWSEHRGLFRILSPACREFGIRLILSGGSDSLSIRSTEAEAATGRDVQTVVLHLGDRDRAGEKIFKVLVEDLPALCIGGVSDVVRVALTPVKGAGFGMGYPGESVQIDALSVQGIGGLLVDDVRVRQDPDIRRPVIEREAKERAVG